MQMAAMLAATAPSGWRRTTTAFATPRAVARCPRRLAVLTAASSATASAPAPSQGEADVTARKAEVQRWIASYRERTAAAAAGGGLFGWIARQRARTMELRAKVAALGAAAVLAYGIFDGITYTAAFVLSWLAYEARTGLNPTQNVKDILLLMVAMWAGNNVTRPFRIAGAAALAPALDKFMEGLQARLRLRSKAAAFAIIVACVAACCFSIVGFLFVSRWVAQ